MIWVILEAQKAPKRYVYNDFGEPAQPASQPTRLWLAGWLAGCVCFFFVLGFCMFFLYFYVFCLWILFCLKAGWLRLTYFCTGLSGVDFPAFLCLLFLELFCLKAGWLAGWLGRARTKTKQKTNNSQPAQPASPTSQPTDQALAGWLAGCV